MLLSEKFNKSINQKPVILIAPLDWGLGHATRCIPIIRYLLRTGCEVIVAAEGNQHILLEKEFKNVRFVPLRGYRLTYGTSSLGTILKIILQIPAILTSIEYENRWVKKFLLDNQVDVIISDNRYGFYHKRVPSVFITHQLRIRTPFGKLVEEKLQRLNYRLIRHFSECWVPDYQGSENLGGELSHPGLMPAIPTRYIGRMTRFKLEKNFTTGGQLLMILSGPEPQRTIFEGILLRELHSYAGPAVLVRGLPAWQIALRNDNKNLVIYNYLSSGDLESVIKASEFIISRSGYSTVMDVAGLGSKCIFVPTPGQSEQEYLAGYLHRQQLCIFVQQKGFSLTKAMFDAKRFEYKTYEMASDGFEAVVDGLMTSIVNRES